MQADAMFLYRDIMVEIKYRIETITMVGNAHLYDQIKDEIAILQLRMIAELIALGCLVAHGDITDATAKLADKHQADKLLKTLTGLHANFFPVAIKPDGKPGYWENLKDGFMTKEDLITLYTRHLSDHLHRGRLKTYKWKNVLDPQQIVDWTSRIVRLLDHHQILSQDDVTRWDVRMNVKGKVDINVFTDITASGTSGEM